MRIRRLLETWREAQPDAPYFEYLEGAIKFHVPRTVVPALRLPSIKRTGPNGTESEHVAYQGDMPPFPCCYFDFDCGLHALVMPDVLERASVRFITEIEGDPVPEISFARVWARNASNAYYWSCTGDYGGRMKASSNVELLVATWRMLAHRGVVRTEVIPSRKLNARRAMKGRPPLFSYYTLKIDATPRSLAHIVRTPPTGKSVRWHQRRGHIRNLRSGRTTNVRSCTAGDITLGAVFKDYKVLGA